MDIPQLNPRDILLLITISNQQSWYLYTCFTALSTGYQMVLIVVWISLDGDWCMTVASQLTLARRDVMYRSDRCEHNIASTDEQVRWPSRTFTLPYYREGCLFKYCL